MTTISFVELFWRSRWMYGHSPIPFLAIAQLHLTLIRTCISQAMNSNLYDVHELHMVSLEKRLANTESPLDQVHELRKDILIFRRNLRAPPTHQQTVLT